MAIAVFGPISFSVSRDKIYTFYDYNFSTSINVEEQEMEGNKPASYIKGLALDEVSFSIKLLKQKTVNVRSEITKWINLQNRMTPYMLIINNKPITTNKFLLTSVKVTDTLFDTKGDYIKANLSVTFKEYARKGYKTNSSI